MAVRNARWGGLRRKPVNEKVKQRSNQWDRLVRLEHRQKLREFWLVALLPLRLVTGDISLLYLIVLGRSGGPMPLRSWFCFWEERKYESLCCRGFYVKYKTTDFGLWGVLYVFVWIEVASVEARHVGFAAIVWDPTWKLGNKLFAVLCRCCVNVRARSVWAECVWEVW